MSAHRFAVRRRAFLAGAGALAARPAAAQMSLAGLFGLNAPTIIVAGPDESDTGLWARRLQPALAQGLADGLVAGKGLRLRYVGGQDGVTGANQFDARAALDGTEALLFPGCVAIPSLAGDSRVRFEGGHMLPLLAAVSPGVVMLRQADPARRPGVVRVACRGGPDAGAVALLGLDLLGVPAMKVAAAPDAFGAAMGGAADAVLVAGPHAVPQMRALAGAGFRPGFAVGTAWSLPVAAAPDLLTLLPAARRRADPLVAAWQAMGAACATPLALALPHMTPADAVAKWRRACAYSLRDAEVQAAAAGCLRLVAEDEAAHMVAAARGDAAAQAALRGWLDARLGWRPV